MTVNTSWADAINRIQELGLAQRQFPLVSRVAERRARHGRVKRMSVYIERRRENKMLFFNKTKPVVGALFHARQGPSASTSADTTCTRANMNKTA